MDAIEAIKGRRSVRAYEGRAIARAVLEDLVDCARLAPTAMNQQAWEFVVITDAALRDRIGQIIGHAKFLPAAAACIAVLSKAVNYYVEDASAATQNILLAATAHGLGSCWVAADKQPYANALRQALGASPDYAVFSVVTLGYPAENPPAKDKRPLAGVLHWNQW